MVESILIISIHIEPNQICRWEIYLSAQLNLASLVLPLIVVLVKDVEIKAIETSFSPMTIYNSYYNNTLPAATRL